MKQKYLAHFSLLSSFDSLEERMLQSVLAGDSVLRNPGQKLCQKIRCILNIFLRVVVVGKNRGHSSRRHIIQSMHQIDCRLSYLVTHLSHCLLRGQTKDSYLLNELRALSFSREHGS